MYPHLTWKNLLFKEKEKKYFKKIIEKIKHERSIGIPIYPLQKDVFNAFRITDLNKIKIVILGQDPYSGPNQANGLAFSVKKGIKIPPSLRNIYKELHLSLPNFIYPKHGCLESWASQGVFLLNTILTVRAGYPNSHKNLGWEIFTNKVIQIVNQYCKDIVFLLWGASAQKKSVLLEKDNDHSNYILKTSHPSPLSAHRGFLGCNHFIKANNWLHQRKRKPIEWGSLS